MKTRYPALWESDDYKKFRAFVGSGDDDEDEVVSVWNFERAMTLTNKYSMYALRHGCQRLLRSLHKAFSRP